MQDGYKRVFWGLFITSFNIKLGAITILPAFIGWIIVSTGLSILNEKSLEGGFSGARIKAIILIILTLFDSLISTFTNGYIGGLFLFYPMFAMAIELSLFHGVINASIYSFKDGELQDLSEKYLSKDRTYIILMGITMVFHMVAVTILYDAAIFLTAGAGIVTTIYILTVINSLKNESYETEI